MKLICFSLPIRDLSSGSKVKKDNKTYFTPYVVLRLLESRSQTLYHNMRMYSITFESSYIMYLINNMLVEISRHIIQNLDTVENVCNFLFYR